jgi:hypothetical protein
MRKIILTFCTLAVAALPGFAGEEKKAGPELVKRGVTSFTVESASGSTVKLVLHKKDSLIANVTVETLSESDHIVTFEPVAGETLIVESRLSKPEVVFRSGSESVTARPDLAEKKWKRSGSESLFLRGEKTAQIVALLLVELEERGMLKAASAPESSQPAPSTNAATPPATAAAPCAGGNDMLSRISRAPAARPGRVVSDEVQYVDTSGGTTGTGTCSGARQTCNGTDIMKSRACNKAKSSCNSLCWNKYCIGCCKFDDCNCVCGLDDFWCVAAVDGYSCSYSDVNP